MEAKKTPPPTPARKASPPVPPKKPIDLSPKPTASPNHEYDPTTKRAKFVKGNQLWQLAPRSGRKAIITDAAELWQSAINYFKWCDENPIYKEEPVKHQGVGDTMELSLGRPYSMDGLTIMLGVSGAYFRARKAELGDKLEANTATSAEIDLLDTIHQIESIVRNQRFEGAAVGIFKENLIARIDGYADNVNQHNTGEVRQNIVVRDQKTADDLAKLDKML